MTNLQEPGTDQHPSPRAGFLPDHEEVAAAVRRRRLRVAAGIFLVAIIGALLLSAAFQASGGRFFIVESPSMGRTAPVGSLVIDRSTTVAELRVGDIISFHPPSAPTSVYTHRVSSISPQGAIRTRGDISGVDDGWVLGQSDLIGKVGVIAPGIGWVIRALPYLLLGGVAVWAVSLRARTPFRRAAYRIVGYSLVVSLTAIILRPFVGIQLLSATADRDSARATVVSTGLLPIRVTAVDGGFIDLVSGQVGHLDIATIASDARYSLSSTLNLPLWGWAIFVVVCAIPLLWVLIVGLPPRTLENES
ncbi:MAG: S26 family signal peptidase [Actinomycetota bacterium]